MRRAIAGLLAAGAAAACALPASAPAALPDDRAYELVSPLDSRGLNFEESFAWYDGDRAVMTSAFDGQGHYLTERTPAGWQLRERLIQPPDGWNMYAPKLADGTADMSRMIMSYALPGGDRHDQLSVREPDGSWSKIGDRVRYVARSADGASVLVRPFYAGESPYPGVSAASGVYRWEAGETVAVGVDDERIATCGAQVGDATGARVGFDQSGFSHDGEVVVLRSISCRDPDTDVTLSPHVMVWRDGQTVDVSKPLPGEADATASYIGNAVDGSAVYFTTAAKLEATDDAASDDLFRYDVESGELERITAARRAAGETYRDSMSSDDGRRVWFLTNDAVANRDVLWVWTAGEGERRIAVVGRSTMFINPAHSLANPAQMAVDGSVLAWPGTTRVEGLPNYSPAQWFRATIDGDVICASCVNGLGMTAASTAARRIEELAAPSTRMSADGRHLFFQTVAGLLPQDTDGTADVYGWSEGTGVWLVTAFDEPPGPPLEDIAPELAGVTPRGDVFFRAFASLQPWIDDPHKKLYVARIDGGLPGPAAPPTCEGDDCQGEPRAQPLPLPDPSTQTHEGPGDAEDREPPFARDPRYVAKLTLGKLPKAALRKLAAGRKVRLAIRSTEAGRVSATVRARIGRRWVRAGGAARTLGDAGTARLTVRLSAQARRQLARRGALHVRLVVAHRAGKAPLQRSFVLKAPGRRAHA